MSQGAQQTGSDQTAIRPFHVNVPEAELTELRRRINATRWPDRETDASQGVQLATMQELARYWATEYDWRRVEARLNALPQFLTEIDGVDIHFIHVRSKHEDALPLIVSHGWPGSVIEQLKIIDPLTNPPTMGEDLLGDLERQAGAALAQMLPEAQQAPIEVTRSVVMGSPFRKIVETAEAEHMDLIVMATHGRTGLSHLLIGSVTERVVRTAPCPVLTIRPATEKA
jgi:nucleotide-binding universal stress UspA family protein